MVNRAEKYPRRELYAYSLENLSLEVVELRSWEAMLSGRSGSAFGNVLLDWAGRGEARVAEQAKDTYIGLSSLVVMVLHRLKFVGLISDAEGHDILLELEIHTSSCVPVVGEGWYGLLVA